MKTILLACAFSLAASSAFADLNVTFDEGAPKDRFTIQNVGICAIENAAITLDLSASKAGLIFDVTSAGAGVEVFQPLEMVAGKEALVGVPKVKDGDNSIMFDIKQLGAGASLAFTIDVDDTMGGREITVSGSEIEGAAVKFAKDDTKLSARFGSHARTSVKLPSCG